MPACLPACRQVHGDELKLNAMKKLFKCLIGVSLFCLCLSFQMIPNKDAQIKGEYTGELKNIKLKLSKVEHGEKVMVLTRPIGDDGKFDINYKVEKPGLFVISFVDNTTDREVVYDDDLKRFYLEPGVKLDIETHGRKYKLKKTNSQKNELLSEWNNFIDTAYERTGSKYDYRDFFPILPDVVKEAKAFKSKIATTDKSFNKFLGFIVDTDIKNSALYILYSMRSLHPTKEMYPDYYHDLLQNIAVKSERILDLPNGLKTGRLLSLYNILSSGTPQELSKSEVLDKQLAIFESDLLKGHFALLFAPRFVGYDQNYIDYKKQITPYLVTPYLQNKLKKIESSLIGLKMGDPAIDFSGWDINGDEHKLSKFKGNLVYVDVWATWCGPCKKEIPSLKLLEEKYHGKPVVFLSISVDKEKDRQKWTDFVKEENLKGVQLMVKKDFKSKAAQAYKINSIPRFMLFDKEGNIVSADAPRPSDKEIEKLLNQYL